MSVMNWVALGLAVGLAIYLLVALLLPEKFQ
jgi:K+-transporting ATPase KdpF subunit